MKILLISPYVPKHFGGGEKYLFDVAKILLDKKHQVFLSANLSEELTATKFEEIQKSYENFLNYSLDGIKFIKTVFNKENNFFKKLLWTRNFDLIYYQTDGSLFFSLAKKNILHIQVPLILDKSSLLDKLKLRNWQIKNTNSYFTKDVIEKSWETKIDYVHQPAINLEEFVVGEKEKIILNVGRFFKQLHSKRQDVLIDLFEELNKKFPKETKSWKLVLAGRVEDQEYFNELKQQAKNLNIEFKTDLERKELLKIYSKAGIYWHATGYDVDPNKNPEKVEHFGISTIEAMASGAVPVVINKGGQPEVIGENLKDLLWDSKDEAINKTIALIKKPEERNKLSKKVVERSRNFSKEQFKKTLLEMINA